MSNTLHVLFSDMTLGFKDSFCGLSLLYHLHKESKEKSIKSAKPQEPLTALARRRQERLKKSEDVQEKDETNIIHRIILCCAWNGGVFLMSIILFHGVLMPVLQFLVHSVFETRTTVWIWIGAVMSWTFNALWILPVFILSKLVNCFWFQDIADAVYRKSRGRPQMLPSFGKMVADILFSVIMQLFFLIQGTLASLLPIPALGYLVSMLHMCLLYSLYSFEYKWFNMGWEVRTRTQYIETRWPYFVGFGLPLAVITSLPQSYVVSGCLFSLLFPIFILSGNQASQIPNKFEFPLRLFSVVTSITNSVFHKVVKKSTKIQKQSQPTESHSPQKQSPKHQTQSEISKRVRIK